MGRWEWLGEVAVMARSLIVVTVSALIVLLVLGGVGAGLSMARQQTRVESTVAGRLQPAQGTKHSVAGQILSATENRLLLRDVRQHLWAVQILSSTSIRRQGKPVGRNALLVGERVAVIGLPRAGGAIAARLISIVATPARSASRLSPATTAR